MTTADVRHRPSRAWRWPVRLAYGAFFVHTALGKGELDEKGQRQMHRFACSAYPPLERFAPSTVVRSMQAAEGTIAASLLLPFVPDAVGGLGLCAYGAGLTGVYLRSPGLRREGSIRPSDFGMSVAKDTWMLATGLALLTDALANRPPPPSVSGAGR